MLKLWGVQYVFYSNNKIVDINFSSPDKFLKKPSTGMLKIYWQDVLCEQFYCDYSAIILGRYIVSDFEGGWGNCTLLCLGKRPKWYLHKKRLKIPKRWSDFVNRRRTDNTMWKEIGQKDQQRSTKHTHKTKYRVTLTPLKTVDGRRCSGIMVSIFYYFKLQCS
jgi:hypothetical protein